MLAALRALFLKHIIAAREGLQIIFAKPLVSIVTLIVIAVSCTIPALFWILNIGIQKSFHSMQKQEICFVYLKPNLGAETIEETLQIILKEPLVKSAKLRTAEENLQLLEQEEGMADMVRSLPSNPLPALIEITPTKDAGTPKIMTRLVNKLSKIPGVDQIKFDLDWVKQLHATSNIVRLLVKGILLLLIGVVIFTIGSSLGLSIKVKADEIRVLKLIGALDSFITRPFIYMGMWYAVIGGFISILFVHIFLYVLNTALGNWASIYSVPLIYFNMTFLESGLIVFLAACLGIVTAKFFVKKQLS